MKLFLIKLFFYSFLFTLIYGLQYHFLDLYYNSKDSDNSIFIWGDSQAYQGIDLKKLKQETNKKVYTAAKHGAGVYDFLIFSERVPENSNVLIAISKPAQIRLKNRDRNRSPISFSSLKTLFENNYTYKEIFTIFKNNLNTPRKLFVEEVSLFRYSEKIIEERIEKIKEQYEEKPEYLEAKQNIYLEGVSNLKQKNCIINIISFPYSNSLKEIENNSKIKLETDKFFNDVSKIIGAKKIDTLFLKSNKNVMYDLTHLNDYGAMQVSNFIAKILAQETSSATSFKI